MVIQLTVLVLFAHVPIPNPRCVWCVCVSCLFVLSMLCGAHPFDLEGNSPENEVTDRVRTTNVPLEGLGDEISDSAKDLISRYM